jgi:hypothetical protein
MKLKIGIFCFLIISKLAQLKASDLVKSERPANRIQSSVLFDLGPFNTYHEADSKMASSQLNEFLEAMEEWEGQIQDNNISIKEPKSTRKRSSKRA